jgi:uncharacterized protein (TIGR02266 family)
LASLQAAGSTHPAVSQAMEAVASSLGLVHALSKLAQGGAGAPQAQPRQASAPQMGTQASPQAHHAPQMAPQQMMPQPVQVNAQAWQPQPVQAAPQQRPMQPQQGFPPPQQQPLPPQQMRAADPFAAKPSTPSVPVPSPPGQPNMTVVAADLGAHSPTNFYKGLSGNDIIDHGGLFVSTYMIPKIGTQVRLKVSLPGGYEFEANAVVKWSREQVDAGNDAPPGFGAQFTAISPEARQLIYRYVRNREPLFHDDL